MRSMQRFANPWNLGMLALLLYFAVSRGIASDPMGWLYQTVLWLPGIIIGLSFHEYAHALVAYRLGDDTPKLQGRVTINPLSHMDPFGFIAILIVHFGWGKPVEIYPGNFKNRRQGSILVSLAGVSMNLLIAIFFTLALKLYVTLASASFISSGMGYSIHLMLYFAIYINLVLMVFNLMPVPPLDGFSVITEVFNLRKSAFYYKIYDKGFLILLVLLILGVFGFVLTPILTHLMAVVETFVYSA